MSDDPKRFRLAGVMGWPISHSRSPLIHNHWLRERGLTNDGTTAANNPKQQNLKSVFIATGGWTEERYLGGIP